MVVVSPSGVEEQELRASMAAGMRVMVENLSNVFTLIFSFWFVEQESVMRSEIRSFHE